MKFAKKMEYGDLTAKNAESTKKCRETLRFNPKSEVAHGKL